jgi:hypothetical protein
MKGAKAGDAAANMSNTPISKSMTTMGISHHILRLPKNEKSSPMIPARVLTFFMISSLRLEAGCY